MSISFENSATELLANYKDSSDTAITDTFGYMSLGNLNFNAPSLTEVGAAQHIVNYLSTMTEAMGNNYVNAKVRQNIIINDNVNDNEEV